MPKHFRITEIKHLIVLHVVTVSEGQAKEKELPLKFIYRTKMKNFNS